jgi:hypothetical protein
VTTEDPAFTVTLTVTVTMTAHQRDAYAEAHGIGLVELEITGRSPAEFAEAIELIPWVHQYATVSVSAPPRQPAVASTAGLREQLGGLVTGNQETGNALAESGGEQDRRDACDRWGRAAAYSHVIELLDGREAKR